MIEPTNIVDLIYRSIYQGLAALVDKTLSSDSHAYAWASSNYIRSKIVSHFKGWCFPALMISHVWERCVYTAPLVMTLLAPPRAYEAIKYDVVGLATTYNFSDGQLTVSMSQPGSIQKKEEVNIVNIPFNCYRVLAAEEGKPTCFSIFIRSTFYHAIAKHISNFSGIFWTDLPPHFI